MPAVLLKSSLDADNQKSLNDDVVMMLASTFVEDLKLYPFCCLTHTRV